MRQINLRGGESVDDRTSRVGQRSHERADGVGRRRRGAGDARDDRLAQRRADADAATASVRRRKQRLFIVVINVEVARTNERAKFAPEELEVEHRSARLAPPATQHDRRCEQSSRRSMLFLER